eukprot:scaffold25521_cov22-Tisochrysis_lutea.AAC.1
MGSRHHALLKSTLKVCAMSRALTWPVRDGELTQPTPDSHTAEAHTQRRLAQVAEARIHGGSLHTLQRLAHRTEASTSSGG